MENIQLEGRTIESHYGRNVDKVTALLARYENGEGFIPSEADIRLLGVRNFENAPELANRYWDTSTLSATKKETVKVILPYETDSRTLTEAARFGLGLINPSETLVNYGINLDIDNRWEKLEGSGVYTKKRNEWFEKGNEGKLIGLNSDMKEEQAGKCPLLLTKLGHEDYVDPEFARSKDEVAEIIGKTFELGKKEHGFKTMMGQYLPDVSDKGVLKAWFVDRLDSWAGSDAGTDLGNVGGRFAFNSVGDAKSFDLDKARDQLQTLEGMLKPEKVNQIGSALDELGKKLLTTDKIYSVIRDYIGPGKEQDVKKALDGLIRG